MMETGKFLVPLSETIKTDVLKKEIELATNGGFVPLDGKIMCDLTMRSHNVYAQ